MDCTLPGSSVRGIFQARILEWVSISFSRRSSQPRDWTHISCTTCGVYHLSHQGSPQKAEHWRTDAFELQCWRRLLRFPWTARGSNQSLLKEINPEYSLEELMLKPKLQYFGNLMQRTGSLEKTLTLGEIEDRRQRDDRGWDGWMASLTWWVWVWASSRRRWRTGKPGMLQSMGSQIVGHNWVTEQQNVL